MLNPTRGIFLKVLSTMIFTVMVTLAKVASERVGMAELLFGRTLFGMLPVVIYLIWQSQFPRGLYTKRPVGHFWRGLIGFVGLILWFGAIARLPLPDAQAINYGGPLFAVIFSVLLLSEKVRLFRWLAVIVGFGGVLIILSEHLSGSAIMDGGQAAIGALMALGSAVTVALAMIQTRNLTSTETTGSIVFYQSAVGAFFMMFLVPFMSMPGFWDAVIVASVGLSAGIGQVVMTEAYRNSEASALAPFDYSNMIWIILISFFLFGDLPTMTVAIGASVVVASGIFVALRERYLEKKRRRAPVSPRVGL